MYSSIYSKNKYVKATDDLMDESINNCRNIEKKFFYNGKYLDRINKYPKEILYTYKEYKDENEIIKCPNCGAEEKVKDYIDGCDYCHTYFNFGIDNLYTNTVKYCQIDYYHNNLINIIDACFCTLIIIITLQKTMFSGGIYLIALALLLLIPLSKKIFIKITKIKN